MTTATDRYNALASAFRMLVDDALADPFGPPSDASADQFATAYADYDDGRQANSDRTAIQRDALDDASDRRDRAAINVAIGNATDIVRSLSGRAATDAAPELADVASDRAGYALAVVQTLINHDDASDGFAGDVDAASDVLRDVIATLGVADQFNDALAALGLDDDDDRADALTDIATPKTIRRYDWTSAPSGASRGGRSRNRDLSTVGGPVPLVADYDGTTYHATLNTDGTVTTSDGVTHTSVSRAAADHCDAGSTNGWTFWDVDADDRPTLHDQFDYDDDGRWIGPDVT